MAPRFSILYIRVDGHDHFMTADYEWRVIELATGACVATFTQTQEGNTYTGTLKVTISDDEREVVAEHDDGTVERVGLARFRVEHERTDAHDHFLCADYEWRVIEVASGRVVACFDEAIQGSLATGARKVELSADEREAIVTDHDGTIARVPLP